MYLFLIGFVMPLNQEALKFVAIVPVGIFGYFDGNVEEVKRD